MFFDPQMVKLKEQEQVLGSALDPRSADKIVGCLTAATPDGIEGKDAAVLSDLFVLRDLDPNSEYQQRIERTFELLSNSSEAQPATKAGAVAFLADQFKQDPSIADCLVQEAVEAKEIGPLVAVLNGPANSLRDATQERLIQSLGSTKLMAEELSKCLSQLSFRPPEEIAPQRFLTSLMGENGLRRPEVLVPVLAQELHRLDSSLLHKIISSPNSNVIAKGVCLHIISEALDEETLQVALKQEALAVSGQELRHDGIYLRSFFGHGRPDEALGALWKIASNPEEDGAAKLGALKMLRVASTQEDLSEKLGRLVSSSWSEAYQSESSEQILHLQDITKNLPVATRLESFPIQVLCLEHLCENSDKLEFLGPLQEVRLSQLQINATEVEKISPFSVACGMLDQATTTALQNITVDSLNQLDAKATHSLKWLIEVSPCLGAQSNASSIGAILDLANERVSADTEEGRAYQGLAIAALRSVRDQPAPEEKLALPQTQQYMRLFGVISETRPFFERKALVETLVQASDPKFESIIRAWDGLSESEVAD